MLLLRSNLTRLLPFKKTQVMQVAECIALDPAGIPIQCDGVQIELADASDLALSFRAGF